jgi:phosphonate transport system substrate-binding protein
MIQEKLPEDVKATLREALGKLHETAGVDPATIRGYGGKRVDRYVTQFDEAEIDEAFEAIVFVDDDLKAALLRKAGEVQQ